MNDINGAIFWKGRYHIFYQHNPDGAYWKWMQWGHASSVDLVHWVHHPIALTPTPDGGDRDGCFSGGAFIGKEGVPTFIYYGLHEGICLATSEDDMLIHWTKDPANPVIPEPRPGQPDFGKYTIHDPCAWLVGDRYYALVNRRDPDGKGDGAFLFKSSDLHRWAYVGPFYQSKRQWTEADEDCAVPDFFGLGSSHMLIFTSHLQGTQYYLGHYDGDRFEPETHGRMSWAGGQLGGPRTLADGQGRRIFFDWVRELRGRDRERASGWSGVMTVPRVLSLDRDGRLLIEPVPELGALRMNHRRRENIHLSPDSELDLDEVKGDCLELALEVRMEDSAEFEVKVRCSPDGTEHTDIVFKPQAKALSVDVSQSTLDTGIRYWYYRNRKALERLPEDQRTVSVQEAPFELQPGEALSLRIFLDRSILEVFANGRQCITQRIYPTRDDSLGVILFTGDRAVDVKSVDAWDMAPAQE